MAKISDTIDTGISYAERGDYPRALETLKGLYEKHPDNPDVLYNYGRLCNDLRDFGESASVLERLVAIQPEYKNAKVALAFAYLHLKKTAEAETLLEEAREIDPGNTFLLRNLGTIYAQKGDLDRALEVFHEAERVEPESRPVLYGIALVLYRQEMVREASDYLQKIIDQEVDDDIDRFAKDLQRDIANKFFSQDGLRMDAVYYCLGALETYDKMSYGQIQDTIFEISMLGKNGLDPSNHKTTHPLSIVEGEFTALQLLCFMYVGFKIIKPEIDIGFDLSKEYSAARAMFQQ
jgi:tetratricopeptide (TPR) repeat protein